MFDALVTVHSKFAIFINIFSIPEVLLTFRNVILFKITSFESSNLSGGNSKS